MVGLVVETARKAALAPIVVVVPPDSSAIRDALDGDVIFAEQPEPLGSGDALLRARDAVGDADSVAVLYADVPALRPDTIEGLVARHDETGAAVTLLTARRDHPDGLGRVVRSPAGRVLQIVEERDADDAIRSITEVNAGTCCLATSWLWDSLAALGSSRSGEVYLTDLVAVASRQGLTVESRESKDPDETLGVNDRVQLAEAEAVLRRRILSDWMLRGVSVPDPSSVYIDATARLGQDTVVLPNTHILGRTRIGLNCEIGPNAVVRDSEIGDQCKVIASVVEASELRQGVDVGPFSHIRPGSTLEEDTHIGNFAEVKNSRLGPGTRSGHFSYIGDADVGANVNIGAGTVTCNFDGEKKSQTSIGDDAFIGSDTMLVAPVKIGSGSSTSAGSVVTRDVPDGSRAIGAPARVVQKKKRTGPAKSTGGARRVRR
jgi:bifunctional UDP-N-acetylglucosamine pyrophosphorylase/glucosamine-1-phosphate N-acetyltransferase